MTEQNLKILLTDQMCVAEAAAKVLQNSFVRSQVVVSKHQRTDDALVTDQEILEALTARFSRFSDLLLQRVFRTLDQLELMDEGTQLDRLQRFEKRGIISSAADWRIIREVRNDITHEYVLDVDDEVIVDTLRWTPELLATWDRLRKYCINKSY